VYAESEGDEQEGLLLENSNAPYGTARAWTLETWDASDPSHEPSMHSSSPCTDSVGRSLDGGGSGRELLLALLRNMPALQARQVLSEWPSMKLWKVVSANAHLFIPSGLITAGDVIGVLSRWTTTGTKRHTRSL
jgi:hypothetical protein